MSGELANTGKILIYQNEKGDTGPSIRRSMFTSKKIQSG